MTQETQQKIESLLKEARDKNDEAARLLAESMTEKAGPWVPKKGEGFYYVMNDGFEWKVRHMFCGPAGYETRIRVGNCFRTESEAQEVATQRNFMTGYLSAGEREPAADGWVLALCDQIVEGGQHKLHVRNTKKIFVERKCSTREKLLAWVEKWGGESAVVERLQRGWI